MPLLKQRGKDNDKTHHRHDAAGRSAALDSALTATADNHRKQVRFPDVGWTDITAATAPTSTVFKGLGYEVKTYVLGAPMTFASLNNEDNEEAFGPFPRKFHQGTRSLPGLPPENKSHGHYHDLLIFKST